MTTDYYIDPAYTGGTRNGTSSNPWNHLLDTVTNTPWTVINSALVTGAVNVYFSARLAASDSLKRDTHRIELNRTNASSNILSFIGNTKYNSTSGASAPNWLTYSGTQKFRIISVSPPLTNFGGGTNNNYITIKGFQFKSQYGQNCVMEGMSDLIFSDNELWCGVGSGYSVSSGVSTTCTGSGTGLTINILEVDDEGSILRFSIAVAGTGYTAYNEDTPVYVTLNTGNGDASLTVRAVDGSGVPQYVWSIGPGPNISIGHTTNFGTDYPSNVQILRNIIHHTYGEGIYCAGSTGDPGNGFGYSTATGITTTGGSGTGLTIDIITVDGAGGITVFVINNAGTGYLLNDLITIVGGTAAAVYEIFAVSGTTVTILSNRHTGDNYLIENNYIYATGTLGGQGDGIDIKDGMTNVIIRNNTIDMSLCSGGQIQGILVQCAKLIENNFVYNPFHQGISLETSWNNAFGKDGCIIRNNIIYNNGIYSARYALTMSGPAVVGVGWVNTEIYNNTIYAYHSGGAYAGSAEKVKNNIFVAIVPETGFPVIFNSIPTEHSNNLYMGDSGGYILRVYTAYPTHHDYDYSDYLSWETGIIYGMPTFANISAPTLPASFALLADSLGLGVGVTLSPIFSDYNGNNRLIPWDLGALAYSVGANPTVVAMSLMGCCLG